MQSLYELFLLMPELCLLPNWSATHSQLSGISNRFNRLSHLPIPIPHFPYKIYPIDSLMVSMSCIIIQCQISVLKWSICPKPNIPLFNLSKMPMTIDNWYHYLSVQRLMVPVYGAHSDRCCYPSRTLRKANFPVITALSRLSTCPHSLKGLRRSATLSDAIMTS